MTSLANIPSIQNIVDEDKIIDKVRDFDQQVKSLFRSQVYETFPIHDFVAHSNYTTDQRFHVLVDQLEDWNKRVDAKNVKRDAKAQFYRNSFLFTSLKNILISGSKGSPNYQTSINNLFEWWQKTSKNQIKMFSSIKKRPMQDDDWKVRKTFKSNLPLEITNYERRVMFASQGQYRKFFPNKKLFLSNQKIAVNSASMQEYRSKQLKSRETRQDSQIESAKNLLKVKQTRFNEDHCQNAEYFQGQFNVLSKTTEFFNKKKKSRMNSGKNSPSHQLLDEQANEIENIKKYRLTNYFTAKKDPFFIERNQDKNKTAASFATTKPFDLTTPDIDDNFKTKKSNFVKQISTDYESSSKNKSTFREGFLDSYITDEFIDFQEIKNWDGPKLMSNPFEHKKPLKKKKKQ